MKQKWFKSIALAVAAGMVLTAAGCGSKNEPAAGGDTKGNDVKAIHLKMNHTVSETSSWHTYSLKFAELIEERTNGRYIVDVFANEQLASGSQNKTLEMLRAGTIDLDLHSTTIWAGMDDRFSIVLMPWILPSFEDVDQFLAGESGVKFLSLVSENGCVPIALGENGYRQVLNNKHPIIKPEDMDNLKIRVPGMTMFVDFYRELGADATTMNWGEVFSALQQKTIDGMESPPEIIETGRFQEVNKYMTMWNACYDPLVLSMSQKLYESLSEEDRKIFLDTGREVMQEQANYQRKANETSTENLSKSLEIYNMTADEMKVFRDAVQPIYDKYRDTFPEELRKALNY